MSMSSDDPGSKIGDLLKKAVTIGAGAYVSAEDKIKGTLNAVQIPKEMIKEALESFFESYTISINAEIRLSPKRKFDPREPAPTKASEDPKNSGGAI